MAKIDARHVMALRRLTDWPVTHCRRALDEAEGDLVAVVRRLRSSRANFGWFVSDTRVADVLAEFGIPFSAVVSPPRPISDEEVIEVLTSGGHLVSDYVLVGRMIYSVNARSQFVVLRISDDDLASAARAYLQRIGRPWYPTIATYRAAEAAR